MTTPHVSQHVPTVPGLHACNALVRYSYDHDHSDTREYNETLLILAADAHEAKELAGLHWETLNHRSESHNYELISDIEVNPVLNGPAIRAEHTRIMDRYTSKHGN